MIGSKTEPDATIDVDDVVRSKTFTRGPDAVQYAMYRQSSEIDGLDEALLPLVIRVHVNVSLSN